MIKAFEKENKSIGLDPLKYWKLLHWYTNDKQLVLVLQTIRLVD